MSRFTYYPAPDDIPPVSPRRKPEASYYRYDEGHAGRLTAALPAAPFYGHASHIRYPLDPPPGFSRPTHCHCTSAIVCHCGPVYEPTTVHHCHHNSATVCHCASNLKNPPNVPAYCAPAFHNDEHVKAPVIHLPHTVSYSRGTGHHSYGHPTAHGSYGPRHWCGPDNDTIAWQGSSRAEVDMQNRDIYEQHRHELVPYKETPGDYQYWCKELDGSYTLRTIGEINDECRDGNWQLSSENYYYWIREEKKKKK